MRVDHGSARLPSSLVIACIEYAFMERELLCAQSWCAPGGVLLGVTGYTAVDIHFCMRGYLWLAV